MDVAKYNKRAWDREVERGNEWTVPVTPEQVAEARTGTLRIFLTPTKPVPMNWYPKLAGARILCLASGGGQQGPLFAAVGAKVTVFDNSPKQLDRDRQVAEREVLSIETVEGDMADLSIFRDGTFDLVVNPVSTTFVPNVRPVWKEAFRVLRPGSALLTGFMNPAIYLFDQELLETTRELRVMNKLPYSDLTSLGADKLKKYLETERPLEFSHSLEDFIGGQLDAGFLLTNLFEDSYPEKYNDPVAKFIPVCIATRAVKPDRKSPEKTNI